MRLATVRIGSEVVAEQSVTWSAANGHNRPPVICRRSGILPRLDFMIPINNRGWKPLLRRVVDTVRRDYDASWLTCLGRKETIVSRGLNVLFLPKTAAPNVRRTSL